MFVDAGDFTETMLSQLVPFKPRCAPVRVVRTHVTSPDIALYQTRGRGISTTRQLVCVKASQRRSADLSDFPCSLQAALHNVAAVAEPSSSCPPKALTALATAQRALGGCFFLVSCGQYSSDHPQAGKPAHALLHLVLLAVRRAAAGSSSPYSIKGEPMVVSAVQDVHLAPDTLACVVAYELGSNGQPTGEENFGVPCCTGCRRVRGMQCTTNCNRNMFL